MVFKKYVLIPVLVKHQFKNKNVYNTEKLTKKKKTMIGRILWRKLDYVASGRNIGVAQSF